MEGGWERGTERREDVFLFLRWIGVGMSLIEGTTTKRLQEGREEGHQMGVLIICRISMFIACAWFVLIGPCVWNGWKANRDDGKERRESHMGFGPSPSFEL